MKKRLLLLVVIVIILAAGILLTSCSTFALWFNQDTDSKEKEVPNTEVNASLKYIIFVALDSDGSMIESGSETTTVSLGVIGYTGLIAELVIPDTYTISSTEYDVTAVLVENTPENYKCYRDGVPYADIGAIFGNNSVVSSIVFGANVSSIAGAAFQSMTALEGITFKRSVEQGSTSLGGYAFLNCTALNSVVGTYTDSTGTAFTGCTSL